MTSGTAAKCREEVRLTESMLRVDHFPACGDPTHIELNPYWVRAYVDEAVQSRGAISLASHGRRLQIRTFLSPRERLSFAKALRFALECAITRLIVGQARPSTSNIS